MIAKARYEKQEALLSNLESWQRTSGRAYELFSFSKFLLAWSVGCAALSSTLPDATPLSYSRVVLIVLLVICFGLFSACRHAYAMEQLTYARLNTAEVMLDSEAPKEDKPDSETSKPQESVSSGNFQERPWWRVGLGLMEWWRMLKHYDYLALAHPSSNQRMWLQGILRNSSNVLWFIMAAVIIWLLSKLSWWVGCFLYVGYVSITIINCLTIIVLLIGAFGRSAIAVLKPWLLKKYSWLLPKNAFDGFSITREDEYWLTAAGLRGVEGLVAIMLCRILARYFF
jgi:hypothetical protein